jgi:hypothetical protein
MNYANQQSISSDIYNLAFKMLLCSICQQSFKNHFINSLRFTPDNLVRVGESNTFRTLHPVPYINVVKKEDGKTTVSIVLKF